MLMGKTRSIEDLLTALTKDLSAQDILSADITSDIANAITKRRISLGMNQSQLAEVLGKTQSTISKWENGDANFTIDTLSDIAVALGMDLVVKLKAPVKVQASNGYLCSSSKVIDITRFLTASQSNANYESDVLKEM